MKRSRSGVLLGGLFVAVVLLAVAGAAVALHYVPFDAPSFAVWTGIALAAASFVCVLKPPRFLGVHSRLPVRGPAPDKEWEVAMIPSSSPRLRKSLEREARSAPRRVTPAG